MGSRETMQNGVVIKARKEAPTTTMTETPPNKRQVNPVEMEKEEDQRWYEVRKIFIVLNVGL